MVGFEVPAGATLEFRTANADGPWTAWTPVEVEPKEGPDPGSAEAANSNRHMSQPVWVGEASRLQTRLDGGRPNANAGQVGVHLIDSSGLSRSWGRRVVDRLRAAWRGTPPAAEAQMDRPPIVTRAQWGADESLRRSTGSYASGIKMGLVHHTAGRNAYTRAQADDVVRGVYRYHVQSNGWSDVGYNFLVDRFGTIYEGRYGGVTRAVIGAHAGGFNTATFGVSLMGSFDNARPPKPMRRALKRLLAWKFDLHHVNVLGSTTYTSYGSSKYAAGRTVRLHRLSGHRDVSLTACPGGVAYQRLSRFRKRIATLQGAVIHTPRVSPSSVKVVDGRSVSGALNFTAGLRPAGSWKLTVTSSAGVPVHTSTGYGSAVDHRWLPVGVQPGTYRYALTSPGRRAVIGKVRLRAPEISARASATTATFDPTLALHDAVTFTGQLWRGAQWKLRITDPTGTHVALRKGTGKTLDVDWSGPVTIPGRYSWRVAAEGAAAVTGSLRLTADFVERLGGSDSAANAAAAISRRTFAASTATHAVLTPAWSPSLAMAAGPLAGGAGPVLYSDRDTLPDATLTELQRVLPAHSPLYVMGDTSYLSDAAIAQLAAQWTVQRVDGSSPAEVAASAASLLHLRTPANTTAVLTGTSSGGWQQGVAGTTYAAAESMPVLLTKATALDPATAGALNASGITKVIIVGNTGAVSEAVADAVAASVPTREVVRISGDSPAQTAVRVARRLFLRTTASPTDSWHFANLSRDDGWLRALAAVPLRVGTGAALLRAGTTGAGATTHDYLDNLGYTRRILGRGVVLGDRHHVSATVRGALALQLQ